jgi:F-type H+-transporting ATPase subunit delta
MMMMERVARPYARALFDLAGTDEVKNQVRRELDQIVATILNHPELRNFLWHPQVSYQAKADLLERVFKAETSELTMHFLLVVASKGRETSLEAIAAQYKVLWDRQQGRQEVEVRTAVALTEAEQKELTQTLSRVTGKTVDLSITVTPELLGGLVVRMGDRVLDGSVARKLARLGERLRNGSGGGYVVEH